MKRILFSIFAMMALSLGVLAQGGGQPTTQPTPRPTPAPLALKIGDTAPDFTLPATDGSKVKLSDFRGKSNVVLAFYVLAFTGG